MTNSAQQLTLVTGATGKTGRRVVERLGARGVPVRAGSRSGTPPFDWEDRSTWASALAGGNRRLVLLSGRGEPEAQAAERALQATDADWTVVRCSWFNQNFSESFFQEPVAAGEVFLPADGVAEPFVDTDDIADVAVAALTEPGHAGRLYELTGPRLLRFDEAVAEIAEAVGRPIRYVPITIDEFTAALADQQVPADVVELLRFLFTDVLDGRNAYVTDGVQEALGRPARDFRDFARDAAAAGAWSA